jgi:hypothetical protein
MESIWYGSRMTKRERDAIEAKRERDLIEALGLAAVMSFSVIAMLAWLGSVN